MNFIVKMRAGKIFPKCDIVIINGFIIIKCIAKNDIFSLRI